MGLELAKVWVTARGDTSRVAGDFQRGKAPIVSAARGIMSSVQGVFAGMGLMLGAGMFVQFLRSGEEFNRKMRNSLAIMGDVSEATQKRMEQAALEAARTTQFAASEAAESFYFLASAGMDAEASIAAMPQVALFAQAGMFSLARATDLATDAQSALGLKVKDPIQNLKNLTRVTDVLVGANTLANASVEQFAVALGTKAAAALKSYGKDIEEGVAVLAVMADQMIKESRAGEALSRIMLLLAKSTRNATAAHEKFGFKVFDADGKMRHFADIVKNLEDILDGMSDETKSATLEMLGFEARVQGVILPLLGTSEAIREFNIELDKMGGKTRDVALNQMTPFQKGLAEIQVAFIQLSKIVAKAMGPIVEYLGKQIKLILEVTALLVGYKVGVLIVALAIRAYAAATKLAAGTTAFLMAMGGPKAWAQMAAGIIFATAAVMAMHKALEDVATAADVATEKARKVSAMKMVKEALTAAEEKKTEVKVKVSKEAEDRIESLAEQIYQLSNGFTEAQIAIREFEKIEGISDRQLMRFKWHVEMMEKLRIEQEEADKRKGFQQEGKGLTEGLMLPFEKVRKEFMKLKDLFAGGFITESTFLRGLKREREKWMVKPKWVSEGIYDPVSFANALQTAFLREDDPQKRLLREQVKQTGILKQIETLIAKSEQKVMQLVAP